MAEYKLTVHVTGNWVKEMKEMGFNLCVAKKVNNDYTVVWTSKDDFNAINEFTWVDEYEVGAIQKFENGASLLKYVSAQPQAIAFGQTVVRGIDGVLSHATGQPDPHGASFTLDNKGAKTFVVVNQKIGATFKTVWADRLGIPNAEMELTPRPKVMVFFDKKLKASAMFVAVKGPTIEVDYTGFTEKAVSCVDAQGLKGIHTWVHSNSDAESHFSAPVQTSYSVEDGFQPFSSSVTESESETLV